MAHTLENWREAATSIIVARTRESSLTSLRKFNYKVLMLKRSGKSKFMPSLHVFPGGAAHDSDFSEDWLDVFGKVGSGSMDQLQQFVQRGGPGAPMFSRNRPEQFSKVPSELAFRICAIRETFEESGILLARDINTLKNEPLSVDNLPVAGKSSVLSDTILMPWRRKVNDDAGEFIHMCQELQVVPDVWSLYEWSNWLTPILPGGASKRRRFDTAFYLTVLDYIPHAAHDDKETTALEWTSPSELLQKHLSPEPFSLAPPQIIELGRMSNFTHADDLRRFAWERSAKRVQPWFPVICLCDDARLILYPGDDLYPDEPEREGKVPFITVKGTHAELQAKYPKCNRSEYYSMNENEIKLYRCNVVPADGQVLPVLNLPAGSSKNLTAVASKI